MLGRKSNTNRPVLTGRARRQKGKHMTRHPVVESFWDEPTGSWQYVFHDPETMKGAIVDPVWNFDPLSGATYPQDAQRILDYVKNAGITVEWILDTHPHADHFSAAGWLKDQLGAPTAIGEHVVKVQALWQKIYNLGDEFVADGRQWDRLMRDGETFLVGNLPVQVMFSPGHTMASVTYVVGDAAFVHDTLMMPDTGTSRADFPGGSSAELYHSLQRILALPDETRLYIGHDYAPDRPAACMATVAEHRASNIHLKDDPDQAAYQKIRDERDATLPLPKLMLAALQINIRGGRAPAAEDNGRSYLKIPLDYFAPR